MLLVSFFLSISALSSAVPMTAYSNMIVHHAREAAPTGFNSNGPASSEATLELKIAMTSSDISGLERTLYDVSNPKSPNNRKFLSKEQVESFVKPSQETVNAVSAWLETNGLKAEIISSAGDWINVEVPVSKANKMLNAQYNVYTHQGSQAQGLRTLSYSIPAELKGHIDTIHPATSFDFGGFKGPRIQKRSSSASGSNKSKRLVCMNITPPCLTEFYGIPSSPATQSSNQIAVSGFGGQFAQSADLSSFLRQFRPDINSTFSLQTIDGGENTQGTAVAGVEANLDVQYTVGVATGVPVNFISVGSDNTGDLSGFLDIANFLGSEDTPPNTFTTSYGFDERDLDPTTANNLCNTYMQLGARGTSVLFASGDGGVCGVQATSGTTFIPTFPSGCPFVTSVGGTTGSGSSEVGVDFSGGGFSNIFGVPDYQASQVSTYISSIGSTNQGLYNATGRGFPDVAAQAQDVEIVSSNSDVLVAGTSCASPIFASVIALLNDQLISAGQPPLGFLNPLLYSNPDALNDITKGNNPGCGTDGFTAAAGWDPVTGLGSPNFDALKSAAGL